MNIFLTVLVINNNTWNTSHLENKMGCERNFMYELTHTKSSSINVKSHSLSCFLFSSSLFLHLSKTDLSLRIRADMIADFVADVFCLWALSDSEKGLATSLLPISDSCNILPADVL